MEDPSSSSLIQNDEFEFQPQPQPQPQQQYAQTAMPHSMTPNAGGSNSYDFQKNNTTSHSHNPTAATTGTGRYYPIVEVVAPATLKAGYTFDVEVHNEVLTVTVPRGGVTQGQTFRAQTIEKSQEASTLFRIPIGLWKDGLGDFCKYGPFHPSFLCSCLFPLVSLGHIYTRLDLRWDGSPHHLPPHSRSSSFKAMLSVTFAYVLSKQIIESMMMSYHYIWILNLIYMFVITLLVGRTRRHLREKYDIPATFTQLRQSSPAFDRLCGGDGHGGDDDYGGEGSGIVTTCCGEAEDFALAACCYPCVLSQMNRHTAMFDTYEGSCFSSNGLPAHAPEMI